MLVSTILRNQGAGGVATTGPNAKVAEVAALLAVQPIEMVVVCGPDRKILGVVTDSDVMRCVAGCGADAHACAVDVADVMTRRVVTCAPEDDLDRVRALMSDRGLRRIPVADGDGRFLGLVSMRGALQQQCEESEFEERMLEQYFFGLGYR
jgi:CBS domain-containing protein